MYNAHRICIDIQAAISPDECLIYSFGYDGNWSFEELMENYGCRVYTFDHKLKELGDHQHSSNITFHLLGLSNQDSTAVVVGKAGITGITQFKSLATIYNMLVPDHGEKNIDYLKIEPEFVGAGDEWGIIQNLVTSGILKKVRQLEILVKYDPKYSKREQQNKIRIIKSLEDCGFVRFNSVPHASGNFVNMFDFGEYTAFQLSWLNSELTRKFESSQR